MNKNDKEFLVEKIRTQYTPTAQSDIDALRALDAKVKCPAKLFGYLFGSLGAVIMGSGMSLVMTELGQVLSLSDPLTVGVIIGCLGLLMTILNYPLYKGILKGRKKKYAEEILELSEKLLVK